MPVLAVVLLGTNDAALPSRDQHVPVHEYEQHLRAIVAYLRDRRHGLDGAGATAVLLLTPPPVDEKKWGEHCVERGRPLDRYADLGGLDGWLGILVNRLLISLPLSSLPPTQCRKNDITRLYARACQGVGKEMGVPVIDLWTKLGGETPSVVSPNLVDGVHLSGQGNELVLAAVLEAIEAHYPHLAPAQLPMQAPEHFEVTRDTRNIEVA